MKGFSVNSEKEAWKAFAWISGIAVLVCILLETIGLTATWLQLIKFLSAVNFLTSFVAFHICKDKENKEK